MTGLAGSNIAATPTAAAPPRDVLHTRHGSSLATLLRHLAPTTWAYFDFLLVAAAACVSRYVLVAGNPGYAWVTGPWVSGVVFGACITTAGLVFGLYERKTLCARSRILVRTMLATGLGLALAYACMFLFFSGETTRWLGLLVGAVYAAVGVPIRLLAHETVASRRRRVLCVGTNDSIRKVVSILAHTLRPQVQIVGHVNIPSETGWDEPLVQDESEGEFQRLCPHLGSLGEMEEVLAYHAIDEVIVGAELSADAAVGEAVMACLDRRCRVTDQPTFVEKVLGEVPAGDIDAQWFLLADVQTSGGYETVKRMLDVLAAVIGLVLTLPLWALVAAGIRLDSRGPVFFRQQRVGLHGRPFTIYKFRTMRLDAERHGARWASKNDSRVTGFGRFLRLTRLDELPQLWNILRGEMALVGPRPERPEFVEQLSRVIPHYRQRHLIKPGLTGWAQIYFGYGATVDDARRKLCFDLYYLKYRSIDLDFAIVIRTIGTFLLGAR